MGFTGTEMFEEGRVVEGRVARMGMTSRVGASITNTLSRGQCSEGAITVNMMGSLD